MQICSEVIKKNKRLARKCPSKVGNPKDYMLVRYNPPVRQVKPKRSQLITKMKKMYLDR